ncbi:MAG: MJ0042-type zinc finger domain-containing protein, partial [Pseudomonadota bacterium]
MASDQFETRCPECQTVFSVDEAELARADGRVRCGDCLTVFDAREHLLPIETTERAPDATAPVEPTVQISDEASVDTTAPTPVNELRFED